MKYPGEESSTLEFKREIPENDQIIKTVIGFCNRNGGRLVLGVDANRVITGVPDKDVQQLMEYINKSIFDACNPPILPAVYSQRIEDKTLLIIETSSGMNKPYFRKSEGLGKGTYIRLGRSTMRATAEIIEELKWQARGHSFDTMPVYHAKEDDLDEKKVLQFLNERKETKKIKTLPREILSAYDLIAEEHSLFYPTIGGILLFGKKPQKFLPEAMIICSHFSGVSGRETIATIDCMGTLFEQFETAYNFILSRLSRSFSIRGPKRQEQLEIPPEAIREVLLNAIIHRNYHINGPTKISIYNNRIEFFNPGVFLGPLDGHSLKLGLTYIRNNAICKVFREAEYIEKLGSGFITLFNSYEKRGLYPPQVIEGENFIKCILPRPQFSEKSIESDDEAKKILALFEVADELAISDVMKALHLSRPTAGRRLMELIEQGLLELVGRGKMTRYRKLS
jgi:predicted HTH transcriptional regulator